MLIMYLLGMLFHPANVSSLTFALEVKSCSALCEHCVKISIKTPEDMLLANLGVNHSKSIIELVLELQ